MDDGLNMSMRKFLKRLGVTGQQEIERAVREAEAAGKIEKGARLAVRGSIRIDAVGLEHVVDGEIHADPES